MMKVEEDVLYDVGGLSLVLGIGEKTARKLLREGKIKGRKLSKKWYVTGSSIKSYFLESPLPLDSEDPRP
jgi:Holliday junction resolvasome RuvABC DNA-binding subunit